MDNILSPIKLYRLPWNLADNAISWLEPTSNCNLYCDGCYRENRKSSHKTLQEIEAELEVFAKLRRTDSISIAGGEPLLHPNIIEIVKMIRKRGWKALINTNAELLDEDLLKKLESAGVNGFTIHIDSGQKRPKWNGINEIELNELRLYYALMIAKTKGISCTFNATVYPETVQFIPDLLKWAQKHIKIVQSMVFIIYRMAILTKDFDFYIGDHKVRFDDIMYSSKDDNRRTDISSDEIVEIIRKNGYSDFIPCAFLNGTERADTYKWLLAGRIGNDEQILGYVGPKFMELIQSFKHFFTDAYLAYSHPKMQKSAIKYLPLAIIDKGLRKVFKNYFKLFFSNPNSFFKGMSYQTVLIIQPADIYEDGRVNMCDGCPDITIWNNKLVWSCRMEELNNWGQNVRVVPQRVQETTEKEIIRIIE